MREIGERRAEPGREAAGGQEFIASLARRENAVDLFYLPGYEAQVGGEFGELRGVGGRRDGLQDKLFDQGTHGCFGRRRGVVGNDDIGPPSSQFAHEMALELLRWRGHHSLD